MEPRLEVLSLFLKALGEDFSIASLDDRLRIQKAIYLGQLFEVDLGYRYSWYVKGPYCPSLTQDYYKLAEVAEAAPQGLTLRQDIQSKLENARNFLSKPAGVELNTPQWYELLASLHYLHDVSKQPVEKIEETMASAKPHLTNWIDVGMQHLRTHQKA